jgi:hypothetical protein
MNVEKNDEGYWVISGAKKNREGYWVIGGARKKRGGYWVISGIVSGNLVTRRYLYCTKSEAIAYFRKSVRKGKLMPTKQGEQN